MNRIGSEKCIIISPSKVAKESLRVGFTSGLLRENLVRACLKFDSITKCLTRCLSFPRVVSGGPWAPFENNWHLKEEYKRGTHRETLANE